MTVYPQRQQVLPVQAIGRPCILAMSSLKSCQSWPARHETAEPIVRKAVLSFKYNQVTGSCAMADHDTTVSGGLTENFSLGRRVSRDR